MELTMTTRPWMPLALACAPSAVQLPAAAPVALLVAERASVSRVHHVQIQAELARIVVPTDATNGTTGFKGSDVATDSKRYVAGGSGVPPRGSPV